MDKIITQNPPAVLVGGMRFSISNETYETLLKGFVPYELAQKISQNCGEECILDFKRKIRLIHQIIEQIKAGELPEHLMPIVTAGLPSTEILQKLHDHKLPMKAEQLYRKNLLSQQELEVVRTSLLSEEILPALSRALLLNTADYLFSQQEITREVRDGFYNGTLDLHFIPILRRNFRQMKYGDEVSQKFHKQHVSTQDDFNTDFLENLSGTVPSLEEQMIKMQTVDKLHEAMEWLSPDEKQLLEDIYDNRIPITTIARRLGVNEKTIRWRRDQILKKLRWVLESILQIHSDSIHF